MITAIIAVLTLVALRPTYVPPLSQEPTSFDGQRAHEDLRTLTADFPRRIAGSDTDNQAMLWIGNRLEEIGLRPHFEPFVARIEDRERPLQNIWAESKGSRAEVILLIANRDSPPFSTQGADNNASGVAALLELARVFTLQSHTYRFIFLWSDGDTYGALGTQDFLRKHPEITVRAALALQQVGLAGARSIELEGWSASDSTAPPWLWELASNAGSAEGGIKTPLPTLTSQVLHLAMPVGGGSQAPLVAAGIPALTLRASGTRRPSPDLDTVSTTSARTLTRLGRTTERLVMSIDAVETNVSGSGRAVFFSRGRALPGIAVTLVLLVLLAPLATVVWRLAAAKPHSRRLGPALFLYLLRIGPWFLMLLLLYFANLTTMLPRSAGVAFSPNSRVAHSPQYLRAFLLAALLALLVLYAHAIEQRFLRRTPVPPEHTVTVVHYALLALAVLALLVNPFTVVLLLPAAICWPLAKPGPWPVSRLPAWLGLIGLGVALIYFGARLHLGWHVWWYFLLLIENRTVPVGAALAGICFVAAAIHLGHHLCRPSQKRPRELTSRRSPAAQAEPPARNAAGPQPPLSQ